jgi:hypothetical protein
MSSQLLGCIAVDEPKIAEEIERSSAFTYEDVYGDFLCGYPWKSCMLWAPDGEVGDGVISHYDMARPGLPTAYGAQLDHLRGLVEDHFAVEHLLFARLAVMTDSVLIPHRDYVEFDGAPAEQRVGHRLHIPLVTSDDCYHSEENTVFQMRPGEVWKLDVTRCHSAAVLSGIERVHLIMDFRASGELARLFAPEARPEVAVPPANLRRRPALTDAERADLLALSALIDVTNLRDVLAILTKAHYRKDGGPDFVWTTFREIGRRSGDPAVGAEVEAWHEYYMLTRDQ